ncbi:pseudouridine synthase [Crucibulum laeve]|uniref:tRNA pseudouridine synthase n=1 Tax=Crucibulum laeve TaxID=68775 RepID=A0A5C3LYV3_9AGAR|nr:pseudouridine synthase [Crucibulum laeve]
MATSPSDSYETWTREQLIDRLKLLERPKTRPPSPKPIKDFHFGSHRRRKIALKFCYSGWEYNGLAFQTKPTPLPTVEGVIFDTLAKSRLIDKEAGFEGCGWEKCGRTDRGVSAGGQVISLWVRSALSPEDLAKTSKPRSEHDYLTILNRLLPPTIRILAWSPVSPTFSARFSCTYRHYKYFFSPHGLNIPHMQDAASRLLGEHDFRNLCKLDAQKQITMFNRKVFRADIEPLEGFEDGRGLHVFNLIGTAFLYHQVRHIMAILLLVGTGLEDPSVVTSLLNVTEGEQAQKEGDKILDVVDRKPVYQMADALPLMLWECGYPEREVDWRTIERLDDPSAVTSSELYHQLHSIHERSQIYTALNQHFLAAASKHHAIPPKLFPLPEGNKDTLMGATMNIPLGGGTHKRMTKYTDILRRERLDTVDVMNERWRLGKGLRKEERKKEAEEGGIDEDE